MWYYTNFDDKIFKIKLDSKKIYVQNTVFGTNIFEKEHNLKIKNENKIKNEKQDYSIVDIYFFENIFTISNNKLLIEDFYSLDIDSIRFSSDEWVYKFEVYNNDKNFLENLSKLFLSINNSQFFSYLPPQKDNYKMFDAFEDISKININNLDFEFKEPDNVYEYDEKYNNFIKNVFKLKYVLYTLKQTYNKIINNHKIPQNEYQKFKILKLDISRQSLEKIIPEFEDKLNKIENILKNKWITK